MAATGGPAEQRPLVWTAYPHAIHHPTALRARASARERARANVEVAAGKSIFTPASLYDMAKRIAQRERPRLRRLLGDNLIGVGVGFRSTGRRKRTLHEELTIRILLRKKWPRGYRGPATKRIPSWYRGRVRRGRKWVTRWIRTDVDDVRHGSAQADCEAPPATVDTAAIRVKINGVPGFTVGSTCAFARIDGQPPIYVLSCKHVLTDVNDRGEGEKAGDVLLQQSTRADVDVSGADVTGWLLGAEEPSVDAAIGRMKRGSADATAGDLDAAVGGLRPASWWRTDTQFASLTVGRQLLVVTRRGLLPMKIRDDMDMGDNPVLPGFHCGGEPEDLMFSRMIFYTSDPTAFPDVATSVDQSRPGDSGAGVLARQDGKWHLVGMHTWGDCIDKGAAQFMGDVLAALEDGRKLTPA